MTNDFKPCLLYTSTDGYFELDDFRDVTNFNTQETLNALGFATSDIAEMGFCLLYTSRCV